VWESAEIEVSQDVMQPSPDAAEDEAGIAAPAPAVVLTLSQARRIALGAQGFARRRPDEAARRHADAVIDRLGLLQIDSVNVLARAHTVPLFSRLGPYDAAFLERAAYGGKRRRLFEYWGHEASLIRLDLQPLLRWRMARADRGLGIYGGLARFGREKRPFIDAVLREVETRGPSTARELGGGEGGVGDAGTGGWWGWSEAKRALEFLFWAGHLTTATRRGGFERVYDLPARVFPAEILSRPTPHETEAQRELIMVAARALGVATERDLRDYFRLDPADAKLRVAELVEAGALIPARVKGWSHAAYLTPEAATPRKVHARALVSPFDPLLWERTRTERLFGIRYRLEIYTPAHKREHGYYVLPFLLGDRIAARVDLKADRSTKRLVVKAAHAEGKGDPGETATELAAELREVCRWLGLEAVVVEGSTAFAGLLAGAADAATSDH
jgi:hypothetical protein